jgi:hypothetical protein
MINNTAEQSRTTGNINALTHKPAPPDVTCSQCCTNLCTLLKTIQFVEIITAQWYYMKYTYELKKEIYNVR